MPMKILLRNFIEEFLKSGVKAAKEKMGGTNRSVQMLRVCYYTLVGESTK